MIGTKMKLAVGARAAAREGGQDHDARNAERCGADTLNVLLTTGVELGPACVSIRRSGTAALFGLDSGGGSGVDGGE